jgi:ATP/maltotriose-dependent transcriptional regulator MalT
MTGMHHIVRTRIVPPRRRAGLLRRARLLDFLHENINRKVVLISAAPGYGKTSLLVDFQQDTELTTTWYSMDASDSDPWTFVTHLVASIAEAFPALRPEFARLAPADPPTGMTPQLVLQALVNEVQSKIPEYFAILIDDFQFSDPSPSIHALMAWFLDHMPENCSLVLASRSMPDLPYLKLAARQEIAAVGSQELGFTAEEIQAYLALNHNLDIPIREAERLTAESEGWITGILLGTHTLWKGLLRSLAAAKGKGEFVFDYLAQEVFDGQPESSRRFLQSTSILDVLRPEFCDALLGISDSESLLEKLEGANLFIARLSGEEKVYRVHALFQEFLRRQFEPDGHDEERRLHRTAAGLYEREGEVEVALEHYLRAGAADEAVRLLKLVMEPAHYAGRQETLARWLEALGPRTVDADPELLVMHGYLFVHTGEFDLALGRFRRAREVYAQVGDRAAEARAQIHEAFVHRYQNAMDQARAICQEVLGLPEDVGLDIKTQALARRILGEAHYFAGNLPEAKRALRRSLNLYEKTGDLYQTAALLQALGTTARGMGNPLEAEGHFARALKILKRIGNIWRVAEIQNNIGVGHYYQGEYEKALEVLGQALLDSRQAGHKRTEALVLASLGDVHAEVGNSRRAQQMFQESLEGMRAVNDKALEVNVLCALASLHRADRAWEQAHAWLDEAARVPIPEGPGYLRGLIAFHRGAVWLDQGHLDQAMAELAAAVASLESAGARRELARASLWRAYGAHQAGDGDQAMKYLGKAVDLCAEIAHPHLLVVDGRRMIALLEEGRRRDTGRREAIDKLLTRIHQLSLAGLRTPGEESPREVRPPKVEILALGEATVRVDGLAISHTTWGGPLVRELFFYLVDRGPVRREEILGIFWPEHSEAKAKSVFHATLYRMRHALPRGVVGYSPEDETYFVERGPADGDTWYDVAAFGELIRRSRAEGDRREELLQQALAVYRGAYLGEVYSDWAARVRDELHRMFVEAMITLAAAQVGRGETGQAVELLRRALSEEPYREDIHRALMEALAAGGRHAEAIRHYQSLAETFRRELNVEPSGETESLHQSIQKRAEVSS